MHGVKRTAFSALLVAALPAVLASGQPPQESCKQEAMKWIDDNQDMLREASQAIWGYAETGLQETRSAQYLANMLRKNGFTVETDVAGLPTAFVATWGSGTPVVGFLAEYDALPGLSQKAGVDHKTPLVDGAPGHGCGHNLLGVGGCSAAMAVKAVMEKEGLGGTVKLFGCPAEETVGGKVFMARADVFAGLDVCFDWHPNPLNQAIVLSSNALNEFEVEFYGTTAHAAGEPWQGRSALDAVELMDIGVNFLREHIPSTARIHYVIRHGGEAPNVVPDYASVFYYVRDKDREGVDKVYRRVLKIAEGAALMTETTHKVTFRTGMHGMLTNRTVAELVYKNLNYVGIPSFTPEQQQFAKSLQKAFGVEETGFSDRIEPFEEGSIAASSDVAEVSRLVPTATLNTACRPLGTPGHSWAVVACCGSDVGFRGMKVAAKTMAASAVEALLDPRIIEKAQQEFKEQTAGSAYQSPLPLGHEVPLH